MNFIKRRINSSGFTLIELLVVIAIIGVLASIVLASLNSARRKSRDARRITDIKQIQLALELFFDAAVGGSSTYPTGSITCAAPPGEAHGLLALQTGGYIPQVPRDPSSTATCYLYVTPTISGIQTTYHLATQLEDTASPAFNSDKDCNSGAAGGATGCGPAAYSGGTPFDGTTDSANRRYDVVP